MDPVVRAGALQGFDEVVARWGGDRPDLGLRVGSAQDPRMLGLLSVVVRGAETVGAGLLDASRYLFVHSPSYQVVLEPVDTVAGWATVRFDVDLDPGYRQVVDGCLASLFTLARGLTGLPIVPLSVSVPHSPAASPHTYADVFGAPISFEQPRAALHLDPRVLDTELRAAQPEIRRRPLAYIAERYPGSGTSVATQVRSALGGTLGASPGDRTEIADLLGLHPRTLQRRLEAEGTTFHALREEVLRGATLRLLTQTSLPLGQVAHALGFSEQSAMNRKVRQWFGTTPGALRRRG